MTQTLLLVEDNIELAAWLDELLVSKEYQVVQCHRGDLVLPMLDEVNPDLIILDGKLPGMDGFELCKQLRRDYRGPILFLTACDEEMDEVLALELGADDYLTKPVRARVLLARIKVLLRRQITENSAAYEKNNAHLIELRGLIVDRDSLTVKLNGQSIALSSREFELLWLLAEQAGKPVSRDHLIQQLRGFSYDGIDRSIDLCISRLRRKLDDDAEQPSRIKTLRGRGYQLIKESF